MTKHEEPPLPMTALNAFLKRVYTDVESAQLQPVSKKLIYCDLGDALFPITECDEYGYGLSAGRYVPQTRSALRETVHTAVERMDLRDEPSLHAARLTVKRIADAGLQAADEAMGYGRASARGR